MRGVVWFRADLRISDNSALFNASRECRDGVIAVHLVPAALEATSHLNQSQYIAQQGQLTYLSQELAKLNIPLIVQTVSNTDDVQAQLTALIQAHDIKALYFNRRFNAAQRAQDRHIGQSLEQMGVTIKHYTDNLITPPEQLLTPKEKPFTSFSAFKKAWQRSLPHNNIHPLSAVEKQPVAIAQASALPELPWSHAQVTTPWPISEQQALAMLQQETQSDWDLLNPEDYSSHTQKMQALFTHLRNGLISPRQFIRMLLQGEHLQHKNEVDKWLNQLIEREFDHHIMYHFPHICAGHDFTPNMQHLPWQKDQQLLNAWQQGQTGYPLIDAAMRCLNKTGYLPQELLQASALFFTKVLFMDWRLGESYFAQKRIDYEFASNNALWQWCASTGAESVIYSRIPQPTRQSEVFDSKGDFIRQYCPELNGFNAIGIHDPYRHAPDMAAKQAYPRPIVDYAIMRRKTLHHFKALNKMLKPIMSEASLTRTDETA